MDEAVVPAASSAVRARGTSRCETLRIPEEREGDFVEGVTSETHRRALVRERVKTFSCRPVECWR